MVPPFREIAGGLEDSGPLSAAGSDRNYVIVCNILTSIDRHRREEMTNIGILKSAKLNMPGARWS